MDFSDKTKAHRKPRSGSKFQKKKEKAQANESAQDKAGRASQAGHNPKAFAIQHVTKTARIVRRTLDHQSKGYHMPTVERGSVLPPPLVVAIVGPPSSGKTTLLTCLVKYFTKQKVSSAVSGPITVVVNKKKRVTLLECNTDINCMVDVAKIADLILLVVDANRGLEMLTLEMSNILQVHGMPRVQGVLTHLDSFKENKALKKRMKTLKQRIYSEIGAKFFYMTKFVTKNSEYLENEVRNLGRFIGVKSAKPSMWRSQHAHLLVDRLVDITDERTIEADPKCDRLVSFYGFVRGTHLSYGSSVHLPGVGDFKIRDMGALEDPCPLPSSEAGKKRKPLSEKERAVYAPMAGIGGVLLDRDATYIDMGGSHHLKKRGGQWEEEKRRLVETMATLDKKPAREFQLTSDAPMVLEEEEDEDDEDDIVDSGMEWSEDEDVDEEEEDDDDDDEEEDGGPPPKKSRPDDILENYEELAGKFKPVGTGKINWMDIVYGKAEESKVVKPTIGGILSYANKETAANGLDRTLPQSEASVHDWLDEKVQRSIVDCFTTGKWAEDEDAEALLAADEKAQNDGSDSEDDGDGEEGDNEQNGSSIQKKHMVKLTKREKLIAKKLQHKALFDKVYDATRGGSESTAFHDTLKAETQEQYDLNKEQFAHLDEETRLQLEGYRPGLYVRIELEDIPCELIQHFNPAYPLIIGGLLKSEEAMGFIYTRFLHHRWHKRILKSNDPLVMSVGWRRFQTRPVYSREEDNLRKTYLKYTPEHAHCFATFYGPLVPQKTGIVAFQNVTKDAPQGAYRIAGTATVLDWNESFRIEKKLKLRGEPHQIFSKTAFIKGMFNTPLEVSRFIGAQIKTVSGVRGLVKQALIGQKYPSGSFRAGFEAPIVLSDLVICRCFTPVELPAFYNPVTNMLLGPEQRALWRGLRTVGEIRRAKGESAPNNPDSHYKPVERKPYISLPVKVPRKLEQRLPYAFKTQTLAPKVDPVQAARPTVVRDPTETKRAALIESLREVDEEKRKKRRATMRLRASKHRVQKEKTEGVRVVKEKERKKKIFAKMGKAEKKK